MRETSIYFNIPDPEHWEGEFPSYWLTMSNSICQDCGQIIGFNKLAYRIGDIIKHSVCNKKGDNPKATPTGQGD